MLHFSVVQQLKLVNFRSAEY